MVDETAPVDDDGSEKTDEAIWEDLKNEEASASPEDESAQVAATEEPAPAEESAKEGAEEPEQPDPWAAVPEELRAERETLQRERDAAVERERRISGGIPAQNRKINELVEENKRLKEAQAPADSGSQDEQPAEPEDLVQARDEYPEVMTPLERKLDEAVAGIREDVTEIKESQAKTDTRFDDMDAQGQVDFLNGQAALIQKAHPDWQTINGSDAFRDWRDTQSDMIRNAALDSNNARDLIGVFDRFKADTKTETEQKPTATDVKREAQKASAETPRPGGAPVITTEGQPEDDQAIWDGLKRDDERQAAAGR